MKTNGFVVAMLTFLLLGVLGCEADDSAAGPREESIPEITLLGAEQIIIEVGDEFIDPGVSAYDAVDGDITDKVVVGGDAVDPSRHGRYTISYTVINTGGFAAEEVQRQVIVAHMYDDFECEEIRAVFAAPIDQSQNWKQWDFRGDKNQGVNLVQDNGNWVLHREQEKSMRLWTPMDYRLSFRAKVNVFNGNFNSRLRWHSARYNLRFNPDNITLERSDDGDPGLPVTVEYADLDLTFVELEVGVWYDIIIEHDGGTITVYIDGQKVLEHTDPDPLRQTGRVSFEGWRADVYYDHVLLENLAPN